MDVQMPVMDGYEATRRLLERVPELPVVGLTAHAGQEARERCLAAGMRERLTKPVDLDVLVETIRACLHLGSAQPTAASPGAGAAPIGEDEAPVDWAALYRRFSAKQGFVEKLVGIARRTQADVPQRLRTAAREGDLETVRLTAHGLKGVAGNLEARALAAQAAQVEQAAKLGARDALDGALDLADQVVQLLAYLDEWVAGGDRELRA
jgi:DNA-binding response OmpR family regulator